MDSSQEQKPHAVCIPYPAQGHINPLLKLAKLLHSQGFHITFVHTEHNYNRLLRSHGSDALAGLPTFRFEAIPDGLPPAEDPDAMQDIPSLSISTESRCLGPFKELINRLNESSDVPQVSCIVADMAMWFTLDAAKEFDIPEALLWAASPCGFLACAQFSKLVDHKITPFKDEKFLTNGDLDKELDWVPCMKGIQVKDFPSFIRTTNPKDIMLNRLQREFQCAKNGSAIVFNSFNALDHEVLQAVAPDFPPLYTLGPMQLLLDSVEANDGKTKSICPSLLKADPTCLKWLDSYTPNSVVYVSFGSTTVMTNDQLIEFAWGLANSNQPFLWITRPDLVAGDSSVLPPEFLEKTKDRGLIASWCNQEKVLAHQAVGGFLTHSGWNSTLESISNGVPMISWPFFAEQHTNCWFCCNKWGIGMEINVNVKRNEVERQVREMMEGEKGKEMKRKAMEWKTLAHEAATSPCASSWSNMNSLIKVLQSKK